jgi:hypothetical protein
MSDSKDTAAAAPRWAILVGVLIPFIGTIIVITLVVLTNNSN